MPEPTFRTRFSARQIEDLRQRIGLNQQDFATCLQISVGSMSRWRGGSVKPGAYGLILLGLLDWLSSHDEHGFIRYDRNMIVRAIRQATEPVELVYSLTNLVRFYRQDIPATAAEARS